jgi:hypothetical protein
LGEVPGKANAVPGSTGQLEVIVDISID